MSLLIIKNVGFVYSSQRGSPTSTFLTCIVKSWLAGSANTSVELSLNCTVGANELPLNEKSLVK